MDAGRSGRTVLLGIGSEGTPSLLVCPVPGFAQASLVEQRTFKLSDGLAPLGSAIASAHFVDYGFAASRRAGPKLGDTRDLSSLRTAKRSRSSGYAAIGTIQDWSRWRCRQPTLTFGHGCLNRTVRRRPLSCPMHVSEIAACRRTFGERRVPGRVSTMVRLDDAALARQLWRMGDARVAQLTVDDVYSRPCPYYVASDAASEPDRLLEQGQTSVTVSTSAGWASSRCSGTSNSAQRR